MPQEYSESDENIDEKIYEYIQSKGGAIGIRSASEDLGVPAEAIREAIERMTMEGRLKA
jgi:DNA-binding Lrp family transcriptional regulator